MIVIVKQCRVCESHLTLDKLTGNKRYSFDKENLCHECSKEKNKKQYEKHKAKRLEEANDYYSINKNEVLNYKKIYYQNNKEHILEKAKINYKKQKNKISKYQKSYRQKNKTQLNAKAQDRRRERYHSDDLFRLKANIKSRIDSALNRKNIKKNQKTIEYLGIDIVGYKNYLEQKFTNGMSWENRNKWHIDHIIPLSSAKTDDELVKLFHYTNTQPLWADDNLKKSNKIIHNF